MKQSTVDGLGTSAANFAFASLAFALLSWRRGQLISPAEFLCFAGAFVVLMFVCAGVSTAMDTRRANQ